VAYRVSLEVVVVVEALAAPQTSRLGLVAEHAFCHLSGVIDCYLWAAMVVSLDGFQGRADHQGKHLFAQGPVIAVELLSSQSDLTLATSFKWSINRLTDKVFTRCSTLSGAPQKFICRCWANDPK
jgi:hypothetical protein